MTPGEAIALWALFTAAPLAMLALFAVMVWEAGPDAGKEEEGE